MSSTSEYLNNSLTNESKHILSMINKLGFIKNNKSISPALKCITESFYNDFFRFYELSQRQIDILKIDNKIKINNVTNMITPKKFSLNDIPNNITQNIKYKMKSEIILENYTINNLTISFFFYLEIPKEKIKLKSVYSLFKKVLTWLYFIYDYKLNQDNPKYNNKNTGCKPPNKLSCFFYLTNIKKTIPIDHKLILSQENANTAFTQTCSSSYNEIIIYRMEEWFKVFIHETIHTFGLDFSELSSTELTNINNQLKEIFHVNIDDTNTNNKIFEFNLYEAYTEIWAEFINTMFIVILDPFFKIYSIKEKLNPYSSEQNNKDSVSFLLYQNDITKNNPNKIPEEVLLNPNKKEEFTNRVTKLMNIERIFSLIQANKILHYSGLFYDIDGKIDKKIKEYKENTSIFSYYIIKGIIIDNYFDFFNWIIKWNKNKNKSNQFIGYIYFLNTSSILTIKNKLNDFIFFINKHFLTFLQDINLYFLYINKKLCSSYNKNTSNKKNKNTICKLQYNKKNINITEDNYHPVTFDNKLNLFYHKIIQNTMRMTVFELTTFLMN